MFLLNVQRKESYSILLLVRAFLFENLKIIKIQFLKLRLMIIPCKIQYMELKKIDIRAWIENLKWSKDILDQKREAQGTHNILELYICSNRGTFVMWGPAYLSNLMEGSWKRKMSLNDVLCMCDPSSILQVILCLLSRFALTFLEMGKVSFIANG